MIQCFGVPYNGATYNRGKRHVDAVFGNGSHMFRYDIGGHPYAYYRRLTPMTGSVYDLMVNTWRVSQRSGNVLNVDFSLYSTEANMRDNVGAWQFCNGGDPGVGFPRDCGPKGQRIGFWVSKTNAFYCGMFNHGAHYTHHRLHTVCGCNNYCRRMPSKPWW